MELTIIKRNGDIEQIFIGKPTELIKDWVQQLNDNPIESATWSYDEEYSDKSLWELREFLLGDGYY